MVLLFWMWGPIPVFFFFVAFPAIAAAVVATEKGSVPYRPFLTSALAAIAAVVVFRCLSVGAVLDRRQVVIRNPFKTHTIDGSDRRRLVFTKVGEGRTQLHLLGLRVPGRRPIPLAAAFYPTRKRRAEVAERIRDSLPREAGSWDLDAYVEDGGLG